MGEDFKVMGEEEIRANMEIKKKWINGWVGVLFSLFLGYVFVIAKTFENPVNLSGKVPLLILLGVGVIILIVIIGFTTLAPIKKEFLDLARKLDTLKKNERICIKCGQKIEETKD